MGGMVKENLIKTVKNATQYYPEQIEEEKDIYLESIWEKAFMGCSIKEHLGRLTQIQCIPVMILQEHMLASNYSASEDKVSHVPIWCSVKIMRP